MPLERSAGAIIFYKRSKKIEYLLLRYEAGHWDFPKGHVEKGEKETDTVKRETKEETGLENIEIIEGFKEWIKYFYKSYKSPGKTVFKIVTFYLARAGEKKVKISWEHTGYQWLPYEKAIKQLTFDNAKEVLKKANEFLRQ